MSLILPLSFFSSLNPPTTIGNVIYDIITFGTSTPYPNYNFIFGTIKSVVGPLSGIGLLNASDDLDTTFKPALYSFGSDAFNVKSAVVSSGSSGNYKFIIGGRFTADVSFASNLCILNLSSTGGSFTQSIPNSPSNGYIFDLALSDRLYAVGNFTNPNSSLAAYEITGATPSLPTNFNWSLLKNTGFCIGFCVKSDGLGNIFVGGAFDRVQNNIGTTFNRKAIAKFNTSGTGSLITNFNPVSIFTQATSEVNDIEIMSDKRVIVASRYNITYGKNLIRLPEIVSDTSTFYESFDSVIGLSIREVSKIKIDNNGKLLACIELYNELGFISVRLYRFNISGIGPITLDTSFGNGSGFLTVEGDLPFGYSSFIYAISVDSQNNIILGGNFTKIDNVARKFYAVLDNSGALLNR